MEVLYINGEKVDVEGSISFTLKSNLLGEFGKIVAGTSQTIKLPRTVNNMRVLGLVDIPSRDGAGVARKKLSATYVRNGVEVIKNGLAVVLSASSEGYEIGITYGVVQFLQRIKLDGLTLDELPDNGEYVYWDKFSLRYFPLYQNKDYGFGSHYDGVGNTDYINVHPCASLLWVLSLIERYYGFSVQFSEMVEVETENGTEMVDMVRAMLADKYILLTGKKGSKEMLELVFGEYYQGLVHLMAQMELANSYCIAWNTSASVYKVNLEDKGRRMVFHHRVSGFTIAVSVSGLPEGAEMVLMKNSTKAALTDAENILASVVADEYGGWEINDTFEVEMTDGDYLAVGFMTLGEVGNIIGGVHLKCNYIWDEDEEVDDVEYPDYLSIVKNLPPIKVAEYIQMLGFMTGTFPMVNNGEVGILRMVSVDEIVRKMAEAYDWSDQWDGEPDSVEYSYLEGQQNIIRWKQDDDSKGVDAKGVIYVDDETLEGESEMMELPLAASPFGAVEQYYLDENGELEENNTSERILERWWIGNAETGTDDKVGYTERLKPTYIIDTVWKKYQAMVIKPIVIKCTIRLTEIDIMGLDYTRPVYLRQLGRYYGIVQVQYKGEESTVELLQIPMINI